MAVRPLSLSEGLPFSLLNTLAFDAHLAVNPNEESPKCGFLEDNIVPGFDRP